MKTIKAFILLLTGLLLLSGTLVAQEGYWVLETMTYSTQGHGYRSHEGHRNYVYTHNYITGEIRHEATGVIGRYSGTPDPEWLESLKGYELNPATDAVEIANNSNNYTGGNSLCFGKSSSFTWSAPPQKIKIGEERMVKMDATLEISEEDEKIYKGRSMEDKMVALEIRMIRDDAGFYPDPDSYDVLPNDFEDRIIIYLDGDRCLRNKPLWSEDRPLKKASDHMWYYTMDIGIDIFPEVKGDPKVVYHYKCVPNFTEVTTVASDNVGEDPVDGGDGESGGGSGSNGDNGSHGGGSHGGGGGKSSGGSTKIPWTYILVGGGLIGAGALVAKDSGGDSGGNKKNTKKKTNKSPKNQKEQSQQDKVQPHSTFQMILYKNFGNTIVANEWKSVGARIEEVTPQGQKIDRKDLTARIGIAAEEGCVTCNAKMQGKYMMADVTVAKNQDGSLPDHAKVKLTFTGPGGMFVNHVLFNVANQPEIVMNEALTFEAEGGKTQYIEFGINNCSGSVLGVNVTMEEAGSEYFYAQLVPDEANPYKFRINVTERGKLPQTEPETLQDKPMAGDADRYTCTVKVNLEGREEPLTTTFDLYRFNLGVRLDVRALKGYLVTYDSTYKTETLATNPKEKKKFGESRTAFKLYVADEATGQVKTVVPDTEPVFAFEDIPEESLIFMDKNGETITDISRRMGFKFDIDHVDDDNTVVGVLHPTGGGLMPPNRAKTKVTIRVSYHGRTYEDSEIVSIISQPYRDINDNREFSRALHEDERKLDQLMEIRRKILVDPRFAELQPFYYKVDTLIESYDNKFGIYEPDYERIMRIFKKYCSGEIGNYFVNNSAWQPSWTEADENFNAFVATFGSMEKSFTGIAARIALGFFTAGASELVFTPMSALVKMKDYADKGGDSTVKAFVLVSAEVVFWEGFFYVAGEALKWTGGKAMQFAKNKGWDKKVKDAYDQLKKSLVPAKESKQVTKQLGSAKGLSTKGIGDKVKESGEKALRIKNESITKANEAIRKTRQKGDAVFTSQSQLMEECSKQARQDAQKVLDEFKKVMNNPTATPDQIRRATLAVQGNKTAQNLLRNSPSDMLRANFNAQIQKIYKEVDGPTIKKLAKRLKVNESEIRVAPNASSNSSKDLYLGKKIGADRDVTFQMKGKDGKWVDIQEDIMEQAYCEAFNEYHYGFMPADQREALKTLHKFDQAVVNGETGLESFGKDLPNIINKDMQANKLIDPEQVARTYEYKCKFWLSRGQACHKEADALFKAGFEAEAKSMRGAGEALIEEGIRMNVKEFKRILDPRIQALAKKGLLNKDYAQLYEKIRILEGLGVPPPKGVLPLSSVEEARVVLQDQYGTTIEKVVEECVGIIKEVNVLL